MDIKRHFKKFYSLYITFIIVTYLILYSNNRRDRLLQNVRYTAGKVYEISPSVKASPVVKYRMFYNNKIFKNENVITNVKIDTSVYYLIKFDYENPGNSLIDLNKKLNISNESEIPYAGWEIVPEYLLVK